jgi:hypothetical protein
MTTHPDQMRQTAPYPHALVDLVARLDYKGWQVHLADLDRGQGSKGLTLVITREGPDTYHPDKTIRVNHYMPVPPAAFNAGSWQRWLFEQFLLVETHECAEYFKISGERPFQPNHGHGEDPYIIHDPTTDAARRTSFRNVLDDDGTGRSRGGVTL